MSETKHTPGPWKVVRTRRDGCVDLTIRMGDAIKSPEFHDAAHGFTYYEGLDLKYPNKEWRDKVIANANLIASAPALYEALEGLLECGRKDHSNSKYDGYYDAARAALAKARGESGN